MDVTSINDGPPSGQPEASEQPRRKRRRIPLACNPCRDRKMRCDGRRPVCVSCQKRRKSDSCVYETNSFITSRYELS